MNVYDFFPSYPIIEQKDFYNLLYNKSELKELTLTKDIELLPNGLFKEQEYISRFLCSYTLYDGIFIYHETGTGKSCTYFAAIERLRQQTLLDVNYNHCIVFTPNPTISQNLKRNLINVCSDRYKNEKELHKDNFYTFISCKKNKNKLIELVLQIYNQHKKILIVIDEIHKDIINTDTYFILLGLIRVIKYKKVIIGSATPMVNNYKQFIKIIHFFFNSNLHNFETESKRILKCFHNYQNKNRLDKSAILKELYAPYKQIDKKISKLISVNNDKFISNIDNKLAMYLKGWISYLKSASQTLKQYVQKTVPISEIEQKRIENSNQLNYTMNQTQKIQFLKDKYMIGMKPQQKNIYQLIYPKNLQQSSKTLKLTEEVLPLIHASLFALPKLKKVELKSGVVKNFSKQYIDNFQRAKLQIGNIPETKGGKTYNGFKNISIGYYTLDNKQVSYPKNWYKKFFDNFIDVKPEYGEFYFKKYNVQYTIMADTKKVKRRGKIQRILLEETARKKNISKEFIPFILKQDAGQETMLKEIYKFSCKYGSVIKQITTKQLKSFVYIKFAKGCGGILFALLLEMFGYKRWKKNKFPSTEGKRYLINYTDTTGKNTKFKVNDLISIFNDTRNKYGKYIQVIIAGSTVGIGIDLKHVRDVHILTPEWNYSTIAQVTGRAVRANSHIGLLENEMKVDIYQYVSYYKQDDRINLNKSVDGLQYISCYRKDVNIGKLEHFIKRTAVNCGTFYGRNRVYANEEKKEE